MNPKARQRLIQKGVMPLCPKTDLTRSGGTMPLQQVVARTPELHFEQADLDKHIAAILDQLPNKEWFTPKEIANVIGRCDAWVRNRFRANPRCFNTGNGSKVYLAIPRDTLTDELRCMYRYRTAIPLVTKTPL